MGSCQSVSSSDSKSDSRHKVKPQLIIKSFTWSRDSHGLFDYESKHLSKKTIKSGNSGTIVRRINDIFFNKENDQPISVDEKDLLQLSIREGNFWVAPCRDQAAKKSLGEDDPEDSERSLWMIVKSFKPANAARPGCMLHEGDLLKLGRIKFRVKELRGSAAAAQAFAEKKASFIEKNTKIEEDNVTLEDSPKKEAKDLVDSRSSVVQVCRICLGEQGEAEDPFFTPCHCTGTMKYIHVQCLQRWLKSKLHVKQTAFSTSIYWKSLDCELCKTTYQSSYYIEGKKYDIVEIERPECGYLMLEILSKEKNILRGIHIIKMEGKTNIRLGRGHDSDIRVTDISVSRCHAIIRLDKGSFYIEDNASKFGTLIQMKKPFALFGDYNNISLQVGRTVLNFAVKKNWKSLQGCFGNEDVRNPIEMEYEAMFEKAPEAQSQHDEVTPVRAQNQVNMMDGVQNVGPFDAHHDVQPQNEALQAENQENEEINLDEADALHDSNEDIFAQQIEAAPGHLVQPDFVEGPIGQANLNVAANANANANQVSAVNVVNNNQQAAQAAAVQENHVLASQVVSEIVQIQENNNIQQSN